MRDAVIIEAVRTPAGAFGGMLRDVTAQELLSIVFKEIIRRTGIDADLIDETIAGCSFRPSDAPNIGRVAALMAGLPVKIPGSTIDVNCASGLKALGNAVTDIRAGEADVVLAGGVESMSNIPYLLKGARFGYRLNHGQLTDMLWESLTDPICNQIMGRTAENLAEEFGISRRDQDEFALYSHKKAVEAADGGKFEKETAPVSVKKKARGKSIEESLIRDEPPNPGLTREQLEKYPPVFKKEGGTVTAGNSCGLNDGAAAVLLMSAEKAKELGFMARARVIAQGWAGLEPHRMGLGPVYAVPRALEKAGLTIDDIDIVELNEAFAVQSLACIRLLKLDMEKVNLNGGAIALGHPVGCTGVKIVTTLLHLMESRDKSLGLATMCVGGGIGGAVVLERI